MKNLLNLIIGFVVVFNLLFPLFLYLWWRFKKKKDRNIPRASTETDFAIIVTAYEQTDFIPQVVASILKLNYSNFMVYVVADSCKPGPDLLFTNEKVKVLFPPETLSSNVASHFYAINHFVRQHDALMIVDSDNLAHPDLLKEINVDFQNGFEAVQGVRVAKNLDTTLACLDAARDIYYHFYDGKILAELGSSATLSGSGMAFKVALYKNAFDGLKVDGAGFDKVLQAQILLQNKRIIFNEKAIIYDQKTSNSKQLVSQRSRWINTWFKYFSYGFTLAFKGVKNFSLNQFLFGIVLLRPPLFIFLCTSILLLAINILIEPIFAIVILLSILVFILGFLLALSQFNTDKRIYNALLHIPVFMYYQLISLFKSIFFNKKNIATKHNFKD
jgi:cellulose synthase/poly-beta-1,6-N-acetylglucosamine synthase-like glycosyltransferase